MKLLFVCQHYWPEPYNITDVCETLAQRGHEITVLTGLPNAGMPRNDVLPEYKHNRELRHEEHNGVTILRTWLLPRKNSLINRVMNYFSFWNRSCAYMRTITKKYDVVIGYQYSPVFQVSAGRQYAKRTGTPFLLYCFDLWPESLVVGGVNKASLIFLWMKRVSRKIYASADTLAVSSPSFCDYFREELGIDSVHSVYLPQYAEDLFGEQGVEQAIDSSLFPSSHLHFMFAGNVGKAQSVETIIEAASFLQDRAILFHIVGSGSSLEACKALANELHITNVIFHGRHKLEEMPAYYAKADVMLVTLTGSPLIRHTLPRKVQTYMAASKPIVASIEGETKRVIDEAQCGKCAPVQDADELSRVCLEMAQLTHGERAELGKNARAYYEAHYSKERFFDVLESELEQLKEQHHGARA